MGATGLALTVTGDGDRDVFADEAWRLVLRKTIDMYLSNEAYRGTVNYLMDAIPSDERDLWGADDDGVRFLFRDFAGCCNRSSSAWTHFAMIAAGVEWERLCGLAEEVDLQITSERPRFADQARCEHFVILRNELWFVEDDGLFGDSKHARLTSSTVRGASATRRPGRSYCRRWASCRATRRRSRCAHSMRRSTTPPTYRCSRAR
jgi:hypothetical protein